MKYLIIAITASLMSVTFNVDANAQILNRLKKKAQKAAEKKVEEKMAEQVEKAAEQMVEKSWNSIFGEMTEGDLSSGSLPFIGNSNVKTEEEYTFNTIASMKIETVKKERKSDPPVFMDMHFNNDEMYTGTKFESEEMNNQEGDLFIIYDAKNSAMLMLMSNKKDKFSFAYDWKQTLEKAEKTTGTNQEAPNWDEINTWEGYTKIGNKNILGYDCDGYRSENSSEVVEVWVSRDADFGMYNLFKANANTKQIKNKIPDTYPQGMIMEMTSENLETGDKTIIKLTDLKKNARVKYTMADYPTMSLGSKTEKE